MSGELIAACQAYERSIKATEQLAMLVHACIVQACKAHGQKATAKMIGVSPQYLNDIVLQRRAINRTLTRKMQKMFDSKRVLA
jgi:hypothetical protein